MLKTLVRSWLATALLWWLSGIAWAQTTCPPAPQPLQYTPEQARIALQQARDRGFLWRIEKDGRSSFLYGTIHVAKQDWVLPGPHVLQALKASDMVALEIDALDPEMQRRMASAMAAPSSATWPEPLMQGLQAEAQRACLPYAALAPLMPELQIATLSMMAVRSQGLHAAFGIDLNAGQRGAWGTESSSVAGNTGGPDEDAADARRGRDHRLRPGLARRLAVRSLPGHAGAAGTGLGRG